MFRICWLGLILLGLYGFVIPVVGQEKPSDTVRLLMEQKGLRLLMAQENLKSKLGRLPKPVEVVDE